MMRVIRSVAIAATVCLAFGVSANPIFSEDFSAGVVPGRSYAENAVLTAFVPGLTEFQKQAALRRHGLMPDPASPNRFFVRALINPIELARGVTVMDKVNQMSRDGAFRYAEPDLIATIDQVATDPNFSSQFALNNTGQSGGTNDADMDAPEGWALIPNNLPPVTIAVLDNGFDMAHPDLSANVWNNTGEIAGDSLDNDGNGFIDDRVGWDFSNNDNNPGYAGSNSHGTHCQGIVGMVRDNGIGGAGAAKNVRVMVLQIAGGSTSFYSALSNAIDYASLNGARVISVSYTIDGFSQTFSDAVGRAASRDVVYVNSAGNSSINVDNLRGKLRNSWSNVVFVASSDRNDQLSSFSNWGQTVDIAAPGSSIYATLPPSTYGSQSGTSMAAPNAAAVIGQIRQLFPALSAPQALQRARFSAERRPGISPAINGGRANLALALETDTVAPSAPTNFTVLRRSNSVIEVGFNASGDNGAVGAAGSYDLRASFAPITAANFASAERIPNPLGGATVGTALTHQITGLSAGQDIFLAIQAFDNVGNASPIVTLGPVRLIDAAFQDRVEGANLWTSTTGWSVTTARAYSGTRAWTDSSAGLYAANANNALTLTNPVTLPALAILRFKAIADIENQFDFLYVEVSTDSGTTWSRAGTLTGGTAWWQDYAFSLAPWAGQTVRLRLRLASDGSVQADGITLDDISIVQGTSAFFDNVESGALWTRSGGSWATTTSRSFSPSNSWTDSPAGNSTASQLTQLTSNSSIPTNGIGDPELAFAMSVDLRNSSDRFTIWWRGPSTGLMPAGTVVYSAPSWSYYTVPMPVTGATTPAFQLSIGSASTSNPVRDGVYLDDMRMVGEPFWNTVRGSVTRSSFVGAPTVRPVTLSLLQAGSNTVLSSVVLNLAANVNATFLQNVLTTGPVDIRLSGPGFISRRLNGRQLAWNLDIGAVTLPNGDADGSGEVDAGDIDLVISRFGASSSDPQYSAVIDVDGSGEIDAADIDIAIAFFGATNQ